MNRSDCSVRFPDQVTLGSYSPPHPAIKIPINKYRIPSFNRPNSLLNKTLWKPYPPQGASTRPTYEVLNIHSFFLSKCLAIFPNYWGMAHPSNRLKARWNSSKNQFKLHSCSKVLRGLSFNWHATVNNFGGVYLQVSSIWAILSQQTNGVRIKAGWIV